MPRLTPKRNQLAALTSEIAQLQQQRNRDRQTLAVLYTISLACRGHLTYRELFETIYRELATIFQFDAFYMTIHEANSDKLRAALLVDEGQIEYEEHSVYGTLSQQIVNEGQPILIDDLVAERAGRENPGITINFGQTDKPSRAWLGVPLLVGADAVGVISLQSYTVGQFTVADRDLLQQIANIMAVALENVTLAQLEQDLSVALASQVAARTEELETLGALAAQLVVQQSLPLLLDQALGLILPLLELQAGIVRLLAPNQSELLLVAQRGLSADYLRMTARLPVAHSQAGRVVRENQPVVISHDLQKQALHGEVLPFEAMLSVPLRIGERVLGSLSLVGSEAHAFDQEEIDLVQAMANQLAIAVENARLFEQQERQIAELQALSNVTYVASTAPDLSILLWQLWGTVQALMPIDGVSITTYDPDRDLVLEGLSVTDSEEFSFWHQTPLPPELADRLGDPQPLHTAPRRLPGRDRALPQRAGPPGD